MWDEKNKEKIAKKKNQSHDIRSTWFSNVLTSMKWHQFHYIRGGVGNYTAMVYFTNTYISQIVDPKLDKKLSTQVSENLSFKIVTVLSRVESQKKIEHKPNST